MIAKGDKAVGRFYVEFEVANRADILAVRLGHIAADKVRRARIRGLVDSGAVRLVLPSKVVNELGLTRSGKVGVTYADGRKAVRDVAEDAQVELAGRHGTFNAIVEPRRKDALIGAIVLEDLDLLVDCVNQQVVPRDPRMVISEIE